MLIKLENGNTYYINKLDDFEEIVEPAIYEAIEEFVDQEYDKEDAEKDNSIENLEDENYRLEDKNDELRSMMETTDDKVKELIDYIGNEVGEMKGKEVLNHILEGLEHIRYEVLID